MQFKNLGNSRQAIPEIGLGTWNYAAGVEPLRAGVECGAAFIDTAEIYGTEEIAGSAIRECRERVFLATKVAPRNFRYNSVIAAANRSLKNLGTDYIDLYQLHWPNYTVPIAETMAAMEKLIDDGKIRYIGVSNFSVRELRAAQSALSRQRIISNQVRYSLVDRTIEGGLLPYCQAGRITVIAFSPLALGLTNIRACDPEGVLDQVAARYQKTPAQVALNWLISKQDVVAIPKASTIEHTLENCGSSGWSLSPEDCRMLESKIGLRQKTRIGSFLRRCKRRVEQRVGRQL